MDAKKAMMLAGVALVLLWVFIDPHQASVTVQGLLGWLQDDAEAIINFMRNLFG